MALIPPPYAATASAVADTSVTVLTGDGIFFGGCFTSTGAKVIKIYDNVADSGTLIAQVTLAANESVNLRYAGGIKVEALYPGRTRLQGEPPQRQAWPQ